MGEDISTGYLPAKSPLPLFNTAVLQLGFVVAAIILILRSLVTAIILILRGMNGKAARLEG